LLNLQFEQHLLFVKLRLEFDGFLFGILLGVINALNFALSDRKLLSPLRTHHLTSVASKHAPSLHERILFRGVLNAINHSRVVQLRSFTDLGRFLRGSYLVSLVHTHRARTLAHF